MNASNYDVVVVGAGAAGLTAAIGLARAGFSVATVEAAPFPGAENWSGCVYFCENLAHPAILGPEGVEALAWERRLVERGFFASDGYGLLGAKYRDPQAFKHCYTVLRPIYDHHLAQLALRSGVAIINSTTVESLIRDGRRVVGVCTNRGPLYSDLTYLAEGDASHLVTREGYERYSDQRAAPKFLQGIKQVIQLPPGAIEERFRVRSEEGVAYEILLRNGTLGGRTVQLNMGGFIYSNRQSLSIGLVLPADNLRENFGGDPNLLIEWFGNLPAFRPWLRDGERGVFGAKIIRGGGVKDIPNLIDEGLAIGGAASAIGVDFPYPNFTGPATGMGLLLVQAACRIRDEGGGFTRENLRRHYLQPLQQSHYWQDVEFLRRWPGYVKRTQAFFDRNLDLALGTAYVWTRPNRWFVTKWINWLRLLLQVAGPGQWQEMRADLRHFIRALRIKEVFSRPTLGRLLLDGTVNALRDLAGSPRANLPPAGSISIFYDVADESEPAGLPPKSWRRWFRRLAPVLASAARRVYSNNTEPLVAKLPEASRLLMRQINILDLMSSVFFALAAGITGGVMLAWQRLVAGLRGQAPRAPKGVYPRYLSSARLAGDLGLSRATAAKEWDTRLARLAYHTVKSSHIHVLWPRSLHNKGAVVRDGLWHVCPAKVYEARVTGRDQVQIIVNFENCIKCETCWRTSDLVDWGRDGKHSFVYPVSSPVIPRLLNAIHTAGSSRPVAPRHHDQWAIVAEQLAKQIQSGPVPTTDKPESDEICELRELLDNLDGKLDAFEKALAREPRNADRARAESLETLARYAQQLALRIVDVLRESTWADSPNAGIVSVHRTLVELADLLLSKADERTRRTWDQRFAWAAADGRQMRQHHITGLRRLLSLLDPKEAKYPPESDALDPWLSAENSDSRLAENLNGWKAMLDDAFPPGSWRITEQKQFLSDLQDNALRELIRKIPRVSNSDLPNTLHPPLRKVLLAELGRRDPSLAYRVACHLWARDLALLCGSSNLIANAGERWALGEEWACFALAGPGDAEARDLDGAALFVPARHAQSLLILRGNQLAVVSADATGVRLEDLDTLGLRGAGIAHLRLEGVRALETCDAVDVDGLNRMWKILSSADLIAIASGMAAELCDRAVSHATSRVQFPGLFHDEEARDSIGKFGAVKKMVAQLAARRYLLETLAYTLSPNDFSALGEERACLCKALAAELLGTAPGSAAYNAGQVFGGTGFSEDDIFSKFYRDSSAWRFLGAVNVDIYRRHGERLLNTWHADGRGLANVSDEAQLFEQVAQRKALQAELDEVRVFRSRVRSLVNEWNEYRTEQKGAGNGNGIIADKAKAVEMAERLAQQDALLLASKALLLRTHARWERNLNAEVESTLVRVWLEDASVFLEEFESMARQFREDIAPVQERPLLDPAARPLPSSYENYLATSLPYDSGDFLTAPTDLGQPRLVPELVDADPDLDQRNQGIRNLFTSHFGPPRANGIPYERYIESRHRPDDEDLDFCRKHGFFRMPIPKDLGGEGRQKIDYYLLITNAQRFSDVGISLCIQVNTSIGTTPILLARDKDLPKAIKELEAFVGNQSIQKEIGGRIAKLLAVLPVAGPRRLQTAYADADRRIEETLFARAALRSLAPGVVEPWEKVRQAQRQGDRTSLQKHLLAVLDGWQSFCRRAAQLHEELGRRLEACAQYLQWIASGQISAFALTEPSAGSDTARVSTRAKRQSVPVEREPDGVLRFVPAGQTRPRYLLDARKLEFRPDGVFYRWSDKSEPSRIQFDQYDYETDDPEKTRYYYHGERCVHFTDISQLRENGGRAWYEYWEMTGAKMWITNGRMAGVFCLYAKTADGVTAFIVDRHSEGLIVGKDEAKLGQWGSPTNELSLQAVRVPLENVLGLEGRGQVNALESLNVGRAGLAVSGMAQMAGIIEQSRAFAAATYGGIPDWVEWRLGRMEEDRFTAEAIAFDVIGRFEHPQTKSVRMESAIAKTLVSEMLQRVIETAEEIYGIAGQTRRHLIEKRKRDARVYNIYEGTNEVQRFLILRDLVSEIAPRWRKDQASTLPEYMSPEALELEAFKADLRHRVVSAVDVFGQELWQNPNFQASCFLLSEIVAWLKAAESTLARRAWLEQRENSEQASEPRPQSEIGRRASVRCAADIRRRMRRFEEELIHLRRGYYGPEIRAASLLFDVSEKKTPAAGPNSCIARPLSILVIVEPSAAAIPKPRLVDGRLAEPYLPLNSADQAALETALCLRDQAKAQVSIQVVAVGPRGYVQVLREIQSLGADCARLIVSELDAFTPENAARAVAASLSSSGPFDLVLGGGAEAGCQEGLLARLAGEALGAAYAGRAAALAVSKSESASQVVLLDAGGLTLRSRPLGCTAIIEAGKALRPFTMQGFLGSASKAVELERWPKKVLTQVGHFREARIAPPASAADETSSFGPEEAAVQARKLFGLEVGRTRALKPFTGVIEDVERPSLGENGVLGIVAADNEGRLQQSGLTTLRAAAVVASFEKANLAILLLTPAPEPLQRRAIGQIVEISRAEVIVLPILRANTSDDLKSRLLREFLSSPSGRWQLVIGESWTEDAFCFLNFQSGHAGTAILRSRKIGVEEERLVVETSRLSGKLCVQQIIVSEPGMSWWIHLSAEAEVMPSRSPVPNLETRVQRWAVRVEQFYSTQGIRELLEDVKGEAGVRRLNEADFIIDVGFGVANRDGFEAVIEPLEKCLQKLGVRNVVVGGSRKVTEELHLLPVDRQIGQSGVSVNPQILLAIGISGAPQHLNYIGGRAAILAFNRDPEAPIMTLNQRAARPKVFPIVGDLFETVPSFISALEEDLSVEIETPDRAPAVPA
jgi:alkylation response protein AidB-like acyl-CoA dehydrogenase/flavin-dependent dehydrogenase/electron transfer flavoprotein alpha subunit/ferredoxin-like protein FixX